MGYSETVCTVREVHPSKRLQAARVAIKENPANAIRVNHIATLFNVEPQPEHLALLATKYWGAGGKVFDVYFLERNTPADLQDRIVQHMDEWSAYGNVKFNRSDDPKSLVRVTLTGDGYWSFIGTDIQIIPLSQPTMCFKGWDMQIPESEFKRVMPHEAGHTLGFPHEHSRREIVDQLDPVKTVALFKATQGWTEEDIRQQILTPIDESAFNFLTPADADSIMAYSFPASITKTGKPILGGTDLDDLDKQLVAKAYPKSCTT